MAHAEKHCRCQAELERFVEAEFAEHADGETRVPSVLVDGDEARRLRSILGDDGLRTHVDQVEVLQVRTDKQAKVERSQVSIRAVLHRPSLLCRCRQSDRQHGYQKKNKIRLLLNQK